jgi:hypothetical protein
MKHALDQMCDGDIHEFMKAYMKKTCPSNGWTGGFDHELEKYRHLSKALNIWKVGSCYVT